MINLNRVLSSNMLGFAIKMHDSIIYPCVHTAFRYSQNPKMDENFHIKSSIFGCLFSPISNHPNLDDYCLSFSIVADVIIIIQYWMFLVISFWMKILRCYYHPILDVSCRQFLDE